MKLSELSDDDRHKLMVRLGKAVSSLLAVFRLDEPPYAVIVFDQASDVALYASNAGRDEMAQAIRDFSYRLQTPAPSPTGGGDSPAETVGEMGKGTVS